MALINFADRVKDTTTTTGTSDITLAGSPPTGYQSFNTAFGTSANFYYCIEGGAEWEVGRGHLSASTTLVRDTIYASTNSNNAVNFSAGTKNVFCTNPSRHLQRRNMIIKTATTARNGTTTPTADPDLQFPMVSGRIYQVELVAHLFSASATPDFKYTITTPTATASRYWTRDTNIGGTLTRTNFLSTSMPSNVTVLIDTSVSSIRLFGTFIPTSTTTFSLDWSQNTSNGTDTNVLDGSWLEYYEQIAF